jgi:hypothetical protein
VNPSIRLRALTPVGEGRFIEVIGTGFTPNQIIKIGYDIRSGGAPTTHQTDEDTFTSNPTGSFVRRIKVNLAGEVPSATVRETIAKRRTALEVSPRTVRHELRPTRQTIFNHVIDLHAVVPLTPQG